MIYYIHELSEDFPRKNTAFVTPNVYSVEVEIESLNVFTTPTQNTNFITEEDHSLRYCGVEYKTRYPQPLENLKSQVISLLTELQSKDCFFSHRSSIHVHANVIHQSHENLIKILKFYYLFEPLFFKFLGRRRYKNNYCVPIRHSKFLVGHSILGGAKFTWDKLLVEFPKYGAVSLFRLQDLGTIEFRLCPGTFELDKSIPWLNAINFMCTNYDLLTQSLYFLNMEIYKLIGIKYSPSELLEQQFVWKRIQ
jgi:hypothetical protein